MEEGAFNKENHRGHLTPQFQRPSFNVQVCYSVLVTSPTAQGLSLLPPSLSASTAKLFQHLQSSAPLLRALRHPNKDLPSPS